MARFFLCWWSLWIEGSGGVPRICWHGMGDSKDECCKTGTNLEGTTCFNDVYTFEFCCREPGAWTQARLTLRFWHSTPNDTRLRPHSRNEALADNQIENSLFVRFSSFRHILNGASVLCIGTQLGGEVRAFTRLGAFAIGIDLKPGPRNIFVLHGDASNLQFANGVFSFVYYRVPQYAQNVSAIFLEVHRVLKREGHLWLDGTVSGKTHTAAWTRLKSSVFVFFDYIDDVVLSNHGWGYTFRRKDHQDQ